MGVMAAATRAEREEVRVSRNTAIQVAIVASASTGDRARKAPIAVATHLPP